MDLYSLRLQAYVSLHITLTLRERNVVWQEWSYSNCKEGNNMHTTSCSNRDTLCMFLLQTCMPQCILVDARQIAMIFQVVAMRLYPHAIWLYERLHSTYPFPDFESSIDGMYGGIGYNGHVGSTYIVPV